MTHPIKSPRKLIEVALPLDKINVAAAREKSIRHGHPSTLHLWWARRPLAAARAVIFAQMVNDPGFQQGSGFRYGVNKKEAEVERERLFRIIEDLVLWENTNNEEVLERARAEIRRSWREICDLNRDHPQATELFNPDKLPATHDPFAGGGAIPLEAQRLGLESYASDLNPVAVTINKAMIEIPAKFAGRAPVGPVPKGERQGHLHQDWSGSMGLAEDVRRYGCWMRDEAEKLIANLYPPVEITSDMATARPDLKPLVGQKLTVIAWLWARTVKSPNPAFAHVNVPLTTSFVLSSKEGKEAYIDPSIEGDGYQLIVKIGKPPASAEAGTKAPGRGATFRCLLSGTPIPGDYIRQEAQAGRMSATLMAVVAEGPRGRVYISPSAEYENSAHSAVPTWKPDVEFFQQALGFRVGNYGMTRWSDLFTARQLIALTTFSDLLASTVAKCQADATASGMKNDGVGLDGGGLGSTAYGEAVGTYLSLAASKMTMFSNTLSRWRSGEGKTAPAFGRQAIAMVWDYAEVNPFAGAGGDFGGVVDGCSKATASFLPIAPGHALQSDAQTQQVSLGKVISTDPPYYDNIGYADLSDFFYVWLRRPLKRIFPGLYATLTVPKGEELVATPFRHGGMEKAEAFFLEGMKVALSNLAAQAHPAFPVTIYYAFKQSETEGEGSTSSTGWETFLQAVIDARLAIGGTWPVRTEGSSRIRGQGANALASSIVLVCQRRPVDATTVGRRDFIRELNAALPQALDEMTRGGVNSPVAPVDLSQAIIGPGMAIFSRHAAVLEADGTPMSVRTALQLINRHLADDEFERDTLFCLAWFEQRGWDQGKFGEAMVLAQAKGTSPDGLQEAGVVATGAGKLRLLRWQEMPTNWDPATDTRTPVWEALHQLIRVLHQKDETEAGRLLSRMPTMADKVLQLTYRLYTLCERKGWAEDARAYNTLATAWSEIDRASQETAPPPQQSEMAV